MAYKEHLIKAEKALANIEEIISGNPQTALIPIAKADANDDQAIVDNAETATEEINEAQKDVNSMGDETTRNEAQQEVNETKAEASETFDAAREATENPETQTELDALKEELDKITPTPENDSNADDLDTNNEPNDNSMRADSNNEDGAKTDNPTDENTATETARHGEPESNDDAEPDYDAFKEATKVDFQPIYEDTDDNPLDKSDEEMLQDAEQDLKNRAKVEEAAKLEAPTLDPDAIEETMREMMQ